MTTADGAAVLLRVLSRKLAEEQRRLRHLDNYYAGAQPLAFLAPEVRAEVGDRLSSLVINWPRTIVDSVQRRCYVEGFRVGDAGGVDQEIARLWQENDLDEWSQLAQVDSLVHRVAFLSVWSSDDPATPRVAVESAHQMAVLYEAGAPGMVRAALKRWTDDDGVARATLFMADSVWRFVSATRTPQSVAPRWDTVEVLDNPLGAVPVVPLPNRPRLLDPDGTSELADVIPLADAVNKLATDMMVASEYVALPRRYMTNVQIPVDPQQRERLREEVRQYVEVLTQGRYAIGGEGTQFGQLTGASLDPFVAAIGLLTAQIAAIAGLPPHFLGINTNNPASADAIRAAEATLVERANEKHRTWGGAYERAMRLAVAVRDGVPLRLVDPQLRRMETIWRDPATPTPAQSMDAAVKGVAAGIYDVELGQEQVGLSAQQRQAFQARRQDASASAATQDTEARLALANKLVADHGLTFNAALAAVGLLQAAALNSASTGSGASAVGG